ncbi:hypothetical protein OHC33_009993 [Knufia fluminis]|uniref:GTP-binding protein EsdC n=1 Tax=Knufia fluminis TaxID=191047 RepID=A0AAN8II99_9EURO|nr:hypothetical protein OHC33_009993 [Knufia fluminis]
MSSPAVQLGFTLRTSPNVRTVHLLGSWDGYKSQLPLSIVKDAAKPGSWKGTFRFQGAHALKLGSRYWYYYIVDGYHVSHDPAKEHVVEKTTGRKLNVLNVPAASKTAPAPASAKPDVKLNTSVKSPTSDVPQGRALSPGRIIHPKPQKPYASRGLREAEYDTSPIDDLEERFAGTRLSDRHASSSPSELSECSESSGTVFSSSAGSSSSATSDSDGDRCRCNRWGVTRDGRRVMLDCGGKKCGYTSSDDSSECTTSEDEEEDDAQRQAELRRRARAQLEAERARNGVKAAPKPAPKAAPPAAKSRHAPAAAVERRRK